MDNISNNRIICRYIDEVENTGDVSNIHDFIDEKYVEVFEGERYEIGIKGAIDHILDVRKVFPDLKLTIKHQISEDDWVVSV